MKMAVAVIRPGKLNDVKEALKDAGISGITICEVQGYGRQKGHKEVFRGKEYTVDLNPKSRVEIAVSDDQVEKVIETVSTSAWTGEVGDGKIFIFPMENACRIRTGETGVDAI